MPFVQFFFTCHMKVILVLVVLFAVALAYSPAYPCTYTNSNGTMYDLSSLAYDPSGSPPASGYSYLSGGNTFYINFCDSVSTTELAACNREAPAGSCQLSAGSYVSCGAASSASLGPYFPDRKY